MSPTGAYDMAGNAKEWCWNLSGNKRYIMGGAWSEPTLIRLAFGFERATSVRQAPKFLTTFSA